MNYAFYRVTIEHRHVWKVYGFDDDIPYIIENEVEVRGTDNPYQAIVDAVDFLDRRYRNYGPTPALRAEGVKGHIVASKVVKIVP